jgi:hypothetical protein
MSNRSMIFFRVMNIQVLACEIINFHFSRTYKLLLTQHVFVSFVCFLCQFLLINLFPCQISLISSLFFREQSHSLCSAKVIRHEPLTKSEF